MLTVSQISQLERETLEMKGQIEQVRVVGRNNAEFKKRVLSRMLNVGNGELQTGGALALQEAGGSGIRSAKSG